MYHSVCLAQQIRHILTLCASINAVFQRYSSFLVSAGKGVQTRRQTDSQITRVGYGHESSGRASPASHSAVGWRPDKRPGPGRA